MSVLPYCLGSLTCAKLADKNQAAQLRGGLLQQSSSFTAVAFLLALLFSLFPLKPGITQ
jgi:hypothetical protein